MMIVNVLGGLGNQFFQFAFAIALKNAFPDKEIKLNISCFNGYHLHNGFELDRIFKPQFKYATLKELASVAYPWNHYRLWQLGRRFLPKRKGMANDLDYVNHFSFKEIYDKKYFDGYWQSPKFFETFKSEIIKAISFPFFSASRNIEAYNFIRQGRTAFIHVRRGDYLGNSLFDNICTLDYYKRAVNILSNDFKFDRFILFSNDPEYTRQNIHPILPSCAIMDVDWNKGDESFRDMQLMSLCDGGIIANSTFSWWGAWLSGQSTIICPGRWCNDPRINHDILPSYWKKIDIR